MKQLLLSKEMKRKAEFGGRLLQGKRKTPRPFSKKKPMHITFKRSISHWRLSLVAKQTDGIRLTLRDFDKLNLSCLLEDGERKGPVLQFFREQVTASPGEMFFIEKASEGSRLLFEKWAILVSGTYLGFQLKSLGSGDSLQLMVYGKSGFPVLMSEKEFPQFKYSTVEWHYTDLGEIDPATTMVEDVFLALTEEVEPTMALVNKRTGGPTKYSVQTGPYIECLKENSPKPN